MSKVPKAGSPGEEELARHLRVYNIPFEREACLIPGRKWRVDFLIQPSLVIEVEGGIWQVGRHQRAAGFVADCRKYNRLAMGGYSVLRFTTCMIQSGEAINTVLQLVGRSVEVTHETHS